MICKVTSKTKCDVKNCKNDADFYFEVKGISGRCFVCAKCLERLRDDAPSKPTPKSPANTIKRKLAERAKENGYAE